MQIRQFLVRQKLRFDTASAFLSSANFILLLWMNNDKICRLVNINANYKTAILMAASGMIGLWLIGYILDRYVRIIELYNRECNDRNEMMKQLHETRIQHNLPNI